MPIEYHPKRGAIVVANFDQGFRKPEMVKRRLCVVVSPKFRHRSGLCTVVPLSRSAPDPVMPYHYAFEVPFEMPPEWGNAERWAKCDMICAVGFHRLEWLRLGKDRTGRRRLQRAPLPAAHLRGIVDGVLAGLGVRSLTG